MWKIIHNDLFLIDNDFGPTYDRHMKWQETTMGNDF